MSHRRLTPPRAIAAVLILLAGAGVPASRSYTAAAQGGQSQAGASRGREVYERHCASCHGADGKGDAPAAFMLAPRPRDFTAAHYKIRTTETGSLPTDEDMLRSIRQGLPGTSMPAWQPLLSDADIRAVAAYIKTFSTRFGAEPPEVVDAGIAVPASAESRTRGAVVYERLQCGKCHGTDGRGTGATATAFTDDTGTSVRATDLAEPWTFRGGAAAPDVFMRFRTGMDGTPMPSFKGAASDADMWDLANYVVSLRRTPVWEMTATEVAAFYAEQERQARADPVRRGEYLAEAFACPVCHSPVDAQRRLIPGMRWAGGLRMDLMPWGTYTSGNLTSDRETGLGAWTDEELTRTITKGILRDGTRMLPFPMDWASFATMSPSDLDALVAFLRTIPPVRNAVPKPARTQLPFFLWAKFRMLFMGDDVPSYIYAGNAGTARGPR